MMDSKDALDVQAWPPEKVATWLCSIGLAIHAPRFVDEGVSGTDLVSLTTDDLKTELGVKKFGDRKLLLESIRALSIQSQGDPLPSADDLTPLPVPSSSSEFHSASPANTEVGQKIFLLDGRNIACENGGCTGNPEIVKLKRAMDWISSNRPGWQVRAFVYNGLLEEWHSRAELVGVLNQEQLVITPRREDVDKFIIRRAIDAERNGATARIVSNDNFLNYVSLLKDAPEFTQSWVHQHVVKFCFDSNSFVPADGFAQDISMPQHLIGSCTPPAKDCLQIDGRADCVENAHVALTAKATALPDSNTCCVQLIGRGGEWPKEILLVSGETAMTQCPHKRQCHLRIECKAMPHKVWFLQITGLEAPGNRAEHVKVQLKAARGARTWCPTCRRPVELRKVGPSVAASTSGAGMLNGFAKHKENAPHTAAALGRMVSQPSRKASRNCAFISVLFGPEESVVKKCIIDALVLGYSLRKTHTKHDLVLMHTPDVLSIPGASFLDVYWQLHEVGYVEAAPVLTARSHARFQHVFTKLRALGAAEYEKVVLLDNDLLVRDNIDELSNSQAPMALRRGHRVRVNSPPHGHVYYNKTGRQSYGINLGVAVLQPSAPELEKIIDVLANEHDPMHQASPGPEQDFLTRWPGYVDKWSPLDVKYNYQLHQLRHSLDHEGFEAPRLKLALQDVKVLHFSGSIKPRDYLFQEASSGMLSNFVQFSESVLIPAYCGNNIPVEAHDVLHGRVHDSVCQWYACFLDMWQDLLRAVCDTPTCPLCSACDLENTIIDRAEHCFLRCPEVQDIMGTDDIQRSADSIMSPDPQQFQEIFSWVAAIHERRTWMKHTGLETPEQPEELSICPTNANGLTHVPDSHSSTQHKCDHPGNAHEPASIRPQELHDVTQNLLEKNDLPADGMLTQCTLSQCPCVLAPADVVDSVIQGMHDEPYMQVQQGKMSDVAQEGQEDESTMNEVEQHDVLQIMELGFSSKQARMALQQHSTFELALNFLLENGLENSKEIDQERQKETTPMSLLGQSHTVIRESLQDPPHDFLQDAANMVHGNKPELEQGDGGQDDISKIVELGFSSAQAYLALQRKSTFESAVELLVESGSGLTNAIDSAHEANIDLLIDMGFSLQQAVAALHQCSDVDVAVESLLRHPHQQNVHSPNVFCDTSAKNPNILISVPVAEACQAAAIPSSHGPPAHATLNNCESQDIQRSGSPQCPPAVLSVLEPKRADILATIGHSRVTIIVAPTGCGKSTSVPQMLLDESGPECDRRILCTQPRRVAATSLARRVANIRNTLLGGEVGFQIGGCSEITRGGRTKLIYAVTAIAMTQCLQECSTFTHLIIDEVHIRDAFIDFLLTLAVTRVLPRNKDVRIVLMSAAMDSESVKSYFAERALDGIPPTVLDLESCRPHRLTESYLEDYQFFSEKGLARLSNDGEWTIHGVPADWTQEEVADHYADFITHLHHVRDMRSGNVSLEYESFLVFLAGKREVSLLAEKLDDKRLPDMIVKCIFGGQTVETQEQTLASSATTVKRTIILATDVVESSVTIPDVDVVIDSCEHKRLRWDPSKRQSLLTLLLISQDEAKQRAGRTARLRPGEVIRLLSRSCFGKLRKHVEPQIRHSRLEEVILSIFELPNLGDPKIFLSQMPDPPDPLRVDTAITRLFELNALDKSTGSDGVKRARPTHFGRFLQKMPVDPEVGCLVMNGVRLHVETECAILAAVHQRGDPFLDNPDWTPAQVRELRLVRDACSPGRALGRNAQKLLPSDLVAGMRAYQAWQEQLKNAEAQHAWSVQDEAQWCVDHYLSFDRLHEIEEMVVQIHDVLAELGYGSSVPAKSRERMRRRRLEKNNSKPARSSSGVAKNRHGRDPHENVRTLLQHLEDRETELLLTWCLAASFTAGIIEVRNGSSTEQVKYRPKQRNRVDDILLHLRENGFGIVHSQRQQRGDVVVSFRNPEEAHRALQEAALVNNREIPWRNADPWGRPTQHKIEVPRACFGDGQQPPLRVVSSSLTQPAPCDDVTIIVGDILPCMDHKRKSMSYFCTKGSIAPRGILPLVLYSTYPATQRTLEEDGQTWKLAYQIHGVKQNTRFLAPTAEVATLLDCIYSKMDIEFGGPQLERVKIRDERRLAVLRLMHLLDQPGQPPMPIHPDDVVMSQGASRRRRNPQDAFEFAPILRSFLRSRDGNDLSDFSF